MPSGIQHNTSSPVGAATSNLHIQKETISHERGIIGETSAAFHLPTPSGSHNHSSPVSKSLSKTNVTESYRSK